MIIDSHQHVFWHGRDDAGLIADMDAHGIDLAWLLGCEVLPFEDERIYHRALNPVHFRPDGTHAGIPLSDLLLARSHYPERFVLGYCPNPLAGSAPERFEAAYRIHGMRVCGKWKFRIPFGDSYMVIAGAPTACVEPAASIARLALAMRAEADAVGAEWGVGARLRIGIHTGPVIAGVSGDYRFVYDVWSDTVNMPSRLESTGIPGRIQISSEVAAQLEERFIVTARGVVDLKGKGPTEAFFLDAERA